MPTGSYVGYTLDGANRIRFASHSSGASLYGQSFNSLGPARQADLGRQCRQRGLHLGPCRQAGDDDRRPGRRGQRHHLDLHLQPGFASIKLERQFRRLRLQGIRHIHGQPEL
ncbi:MAG: hypothetical protein WDN06_05610 [Asticcacaulis sp.]